MWYKGIRIILDALKTLCEKNVDFRMVFVGEGADGAEIRSYGGRAEALRPLLFHRCDL